MGQNYIVKSRDNIFKILILLYIFIRHNPPYWKAERKADGKVRYFGGFILVFLGSTF